MTTRQLPPRHPHTGQFVKREQATSKGKAANKSSSKPPAQASKGKEGK